jgi:hypothetical protein
MDNIPAWINTEVLLGIKLKKQILHKFFEAI